MKIGIVICLSETVDVVIVDIIVWLVEQQAHFPLITIYVMYVHYDISKLYITNNNSIF